MTTDIELLFPHSIPAVTYSLEPNFTHIYRYHPIWSNFLQNCSQGIDLPHRQEQLAQYNAIYHNNFVRFSTEADMTFFLLRFS